jgi:hypothetical protein
MNSRTLPTELSIAVKGACTLSLECWRLKGIAELVKEGTEASGLRHAIRCITDTLAEMGIEILDFAGRIYDPGMVPEVVDVREDPEMPRGTAIIEETIAPTVTWRGQVVEPGQIIVKRFPAKQQE